MAFVIKTCWSKLLNYVFMLHISCHAWSSFLSVNGSVHILVASWACSALQISWYLQDWSSATSCNDHFLGFVFTLIVIYRMFKGRHLTICICGHEFFWEWFHRHTPVQISLTGSVLLILYRICFVMYQNGELIRGLSKRHLQSSGAFTSSGRAWWGDFAAWSRELHLACLSTSRKCSASCPMNDHGREVGSHGRTWNVGFPCGCWLRCWTADRYHLAWRGLPCPSWCPLCD